MNSTSRFLNIFRIIKCPVVGEWPFILLIAILVGTDAHRILYPGDYHTAVYATPAVRAGIGFTTGYILAAILCAFRPLWLKRTLRGIFIAALSLPFLVQSMAFGHWRLGISPTLLILFAETNGNEVASVTDMLLPSLDFRQTMFVYAGLLAVFFACSRWRRAVNAFIVRHTGRYATLAAALITAAAITTAALYACRVAGCYTAHSQYDLQKWMSSHYNRYPDGADNLSLTLFAIKAASLMSDDLGDWARLQHDFMTEGDARRTCSDSLQIALVIGESFIRSHSSIYGYALPTNPCLQRLVDSGNLVVFTDVITPQKNTSTSLRTILSVNTDRTGLDWRDCVSIPALFRRAGFEVNIFDNQDTGGSSIYSFALGSFMFSDVMTEKCYNRHVSSPPVYDLEFLDSIEVEQIPLRPALSIYHLLGQHLWADYPRDGAWERFHPTDIPNQERPWLTAEKLQRIADYDNATLYNDSVVARIFQAFAGENSIAVYFPDHGEEIFDYRDAAMRKGPLPGREKEYIDHVLRVPMFVFMSDDFISLHPRQSAAIRAAASRPATLADVGQMLMGIACIDSPLYRPERDLFSDRFTPKPRVVNPAAMR